MGRPLKENSLSCPKIVEAAIACLHKEGEAALGVNGVARELGIKPPSLYKHFDGNGALRRAVAIEIWHRFIEQCREQSRGTHPPHDLMCAVARSARAFAHNQPALYDTMVRVQLDPQDPDFAPIVHAIRVFYRLCFRPYSFTQAETIDTIRMFNAAFYGFVATERAGLMTLERPTDASFEVILDTLIEALGHIKRKGG